MSAGNLDPSSSIDKRASSPVSSGPITGSRKTYLTGSRPDLQVPMREVALSTGDAVVLYDTSGPYT